MLVLDGVHTYYGQIEALKGVSLEVNAGEIVTLIGANGAGKSTTLLSICGAPSPGQGSIRFNGRDLTRMRTPEIVQLGIAMVPEGRHIFPGLTVEENLSLGGFHIDKATLRHQLRHAYDLFPRLAERKHQRGGTLSGGEQQMLAIGRALMSRPSLLLLDEPSLGLAPLVIKQIFSVIQTLRDEGATIFLVEQNAQKALAIADRGYVLETGRVVMSGSGDSLARDESVRAAYLGC